MAYEYLIDYDSLHHDPVLGVVQGRLKPRRSGLCAALRSWQLSGPSWHFRLLISMRGAICTRTSARGKMVRVPTSCSHITIPTGTFIRSACPATLSYRPFAKKLQTWRGLRRQRAGSTMFSPMYSTPSSDDNKNALYSMIADAGTFTMQKYGQLTSTSE